MKNALLICIFVIIGYFVFGSIVSASPMIQNDAQPLAGNGQRSVNQGRDQIAALPASSDVAPVRSALNPVSSASGCPKFVGGSGNAIIAYKPPAQLLSSFTGLHVFRRNPSNCDLSTTHPLKKRISSVEKFPNSVMPC